MGRCPLINRRLGIELDEAMHAHVWSGSVAKLILNYAPE